MKIYASPINEWHEELGEFNPVDIYITDQIRRSSVEWSKILLCSAFTLQIHYIFQKSNITKREMNVASIIYVCVCLFIYHVLALI